MSRRFVVLVVAAGLMPFAEPASLRADEPSALPGQPGGDPAPETARAQTLVDGGRYEDAIAEAKRALSRDERYVPAMVVMAKSYLKLKKYELATAIIAIAREIDPSCAECFNVLGFVSLAQTNVTQAAANFKRAAELRPGDGNLWNTVAALALQAKSYDVALDAAERATRLLPRYDKAWLNLGSAQRGKGSYAEAEAAYRRALELNPKYADAYFNLGILYLDAPAMPGLELPGKLMKAIDYLVAYKDLTGSRLGRDDLADSYIAEARKGIEREQKRLERLQKQRERDAAKKPASVPGGGASPR